MARHLKDGVSFPVVCIKFNFVPWATTCMAQTQALAVMDMARFENMKWEVTGGWERVRQEDDRVEQVGWLVKSSRR